MTIGPAHPSPPTNRGYSSSCSPPDFNCHIYSRDFQDRIAFGSVDRNIPEITRALTVTIMRAAGSDELAHPAPTVVFNTVVRAMCLDSMLPQIACVGPRIAQIAQASQDKTPFLSESTSESKGSSLFPSYRCCFRKRLVALDWHTQGVANEAPRHHVMLRPAA